MKKLRYPAATLLLLVLGSTFAHASDIKLLNSSYDVSRELFAEYNPLFVDYWQAKTGQTVSVEQSHGGSSTQAQAILQGLRADVVTYNQVTDIDILAGRGSLLPADWQTRLENNSSPFFSAPSFLVRNGNPKNIQNWDDLVRDDVSIIFPNPKTSGNGRYTYLAALGFAQLQHPDDEAAQQAFLKKFLSNVAVFDTGGRGATNSFVERELGDVLISFESEVFSIAEHFADKGFEVVAPKVSLKAEFPVAWVDRNVERNGTADAAKAYLEYLYSEPAQSLLAKHNYRVVSEAVTQQNVDRFPPVQLLSIEDIAGNWEAANEQHFANGGLLDRLLAR
ncbi:thiosulfate ABC transporter substrate-binding protein CysP [Methylophaga lonarensis]|uniref:thiosulfate ABC transporter substrate-binding protein CysP n=1 Tax=Methylophaga lonarensis TaxID=999151 RepID=UPI003D26AD1E